MEMEQPRLLQELSQVLAAKFGEVSSSELSIHSARSIAFHTDILKTSGKNLDIFTNKLKLPFQDFKCPGSYCEPNTALLLPSFVQAELQKLLRLGQIQHCKFQPWFCNPLSVASKIDSVGDVKYRLVLDLSQHINLHTDFPSTQLDDLSIIEKSLFQDAFMWSFDLKDQYHQIKIHD